jgi:glycine/D-amino acid oxidase-like deaminating enzyme
MGPASPGVVIVGGGLAGSLLALALRECGAAVWVVDSGDLESGASWWSYGVIPGWPLAPTPLARLAARAGQAWQILQHRHGDLGWRRRPRSLAMPLPLSQVDTARLAERLPAALRAAGVEVLSTRVRALGRLEAGWQLQLPDGASLAADQLVLAAGGLCRSLWPALPPQLGCSWAGLLTLPPSAAAGDTLQLPKRFTRLALEQRAAELQEPAWVVDAGLAPRGHGALLGQLSWIAPVQDSPPGLSALANGGPPAAAAETWLRQSLQRSAPEPLAALAAGPGRYRQLPVAFCSDGLPLAGPLPQAPGLWLFSGFSGGFAQAPLLAPLLARAITAEGQGCQQALATLERLQVLPRC